MPLFSRRSHIYTCRSLTHSLVHLLIYSLTHSFIHCSFIHFLPGNLVAPVQRITDFLDGIEGVVRTNTCCAVMYRIDAKSYSLHSPPNFISLSFSLFSNIPSLFCSFPHHTHSLQILHLTFTHLHYTHYTALHCTIG